ncbi:hypothetical protein [uncultured Draconibacterium sp.]|uniref:hypothetical protein n=1 Tax=uncultured Draconibacterium sp. TaxID=1573823 RepID=UPI003217E997
MTPKEYLERDKNRFVSVLVKGELHTQEQALYIYNLSLKYLNLISNARESVDLTVSVLDGIEELEVDVARSLREVLIQALDVNDSYYIAQNKLIQFSNRYYFTDYFLKVGIKRKDLLRLIDNEKVSELNTNNSNQSNPSMKDIGRENNGQSNNPFNRIFIGDDDTAFQLFEELKAKFGIGLTSMCFIFHKMIESQLMYKITPKEYKQFLLDKYNIDLEHQWRQLPDCNTGNKSIVYKDTLELFGL